MFPKKKNQKNGSFAKYQRWWILEITNGNIYRQEAASMAPPLLLEVESNYSVVDLCAAPGSKTAQLFKVFYNSTEEPF